ncbi:hypothetical protein ABH925_007361 [Streptacidiphilus sp. EB129]
MGGRRKRVKADEVVSRARTYPSGDYRRWKILAELSTIDGRVVFGEASSSSVWSSSWMRARIPLAIWPSCAESHRPVLNQALWPLLRGLRDRPAPAQPDPTRPKLRLVRGQVPAETVRPLPTRRPHRHSPRGRPDLPPLLQRRPPGRARMRHVRPPPGRACPGCGRRRLLPGLCSATGTCMRALQGGPTRGCQSGRRSGLPGLLRHAATSVWSVRSGSPGSREGERRPSRHLPRLLQRSLPSRVRALRTDPPRLPGRE